MYVESDHAGESGIGEQGLDSLYTWIVHWHCDCQRSRLR